MMEAIWTVTPSAPGGSDNCGIESGEKNWWSVRSLSPPCGKQDVAGAGLAGNYRAKPHFHQPHHLPVPRKPAPRSLALRYDARDAHDDDDRLSRQFPAGKPADDEHTKQTKMSGRYAFAKGLKELRFLFCQTAEHSSATRCVLLSPHGTHPTPRC